MAELVDSLGIPLASHASWLPDRVALWPVPKTIRDKDAAYQWKLAWGYGDGWICWFCECRPDEFAGLETHHISGGAQRHDAPWNFFLACPKCHRDSGDIAMRKNLYRVLTLKHKFDLEHCSWIHLAIGLGRRLPTAEGE